jgi:Flp pilus assembly protein TadD/TolB-like protein
VFFNRSPILPRFITLIALVSVAGCGLGGPQREIERLAVLPFENLSANPSLDWVASAVSGVIVNDLTGSKRVQPLDIPAGRDLYAVNASEVLQGYVAQVHDEIQIVATLMDQQHRKTLRVLKASGKIGADVLPLIESLVRQISDDSHPFPTRNETALKEYFLALSSSDAQERARHLDLAIRADPQFGTAYVSYIQTLASSGDLNAAKAALTAAVAKAASFSAIDRARLQVIEASFNNDASARLKALTELAILQPADLELARTLAEARMRARDFPGAVRAYDAALKIEPSNTTLWNAKAYAQAHANDLNGAIKSIDEYRRLAPNDANASDSLGEIYFFFGKFNEAERAFLEAHQKNPAMLGGGDLYRAALAKSFTADLPGADAHFKKYEEFRKSAGDALLPLQSAVWECETGRDSAAMNRLTQVAGSPSPDIASLANAQLAIWSLAAGDASKAKAYAQKAAETARNPVARNLAAVANFLSSQAGSAEQWKARAMQALPGPQQAHLRNQLLGYALLLNGKFPDAVPIWRDLYANSDPNADGEARVMLAWALAQSAQGAEAAKLLEKYPFPAKAPEIGLGSMVFPRLRTLKAELKGQ